MSILRNKYRVWFEFKDDTYSVDSNSPIRDIMSGFWLNKKMEVTKGSDNLWYIPKYKISVIQKLR